MKLTRIGLVVGIAVVALSVVGCGGDDDEASGTTETETTETTPTNGSTLTASVGPGFEISLTGADGADVTTLSAGTYTIEVDDQSDIHNFHLTGTGVDESTEVSAVGAETWEVTLERGHVRVRLRPARELDERQLRSDLELGRRPGLGGAEQRVDRARLTDGVLATQQKRRFAGDGVREVLELEPVRVDRLELDALDASVST